MSNITHELPQTVIHPTRKWGSLISRSGKAVQAFMTRKRNRRVVANLSHAQLCDCGIDRAKVLGNKPMIEVDLRLIRHLGSYR